MIGIFSKAKMNSFEKNGFEVVRNAVHNETALLLARELQMVRDNVYRSNNVDPQYIGFWADNQCARSFSCYGMYGTESLMDLLTPRIQEITGKKVAPGYSYSRIYYNQADLLPHCDRDSCQYSVTLSLKTDVNSAWPICIMGLDGVVHEVVLNNGDMLVYRGDILTHWRNKFNGTTHTQTFFHFVDLDGEYAHCALDGRPMLGAPDKGIKTFRGKPTS